MDRNKQIRLLTMLIAAFLLWGVGQTPAMKAYIAEIKQKSANHVQSAYAFHYLKQKLNPLSDEELLEQIKKEAASKKVSPIDAKIDRVWKAIPGYNGLEVEIDKTFQLAKKRAPGAEIPFVYRQVPPGVQLDDLGPQPIYKGNPKKPMISLMINVAWGDEFLPKILETLRQENVHATFFFDGTWLSKHIETAKEIGQLGHELSNHGYSHKNMSQLSRAAATEEIRKTQDLLEQKLGTHNTLFAPPSGDFDEETVSIARSMKLKTVLWSLDTVDWKNPSPETVLRKTASQLEPGAMILMHPTRASSEALEGIIKDAKRKGLALGTVSELISSDRVPELETSLNR